MSMTQEQADRIEAKLDKLIEFSEQVGQAIQGFTTGPGAKILSAMARGMGAGR
jgi:hypothetical protein